MIKVWWRFMLVWTASFLVFAVYSIAASKDPIWIHIVCGTGQLFCFMGAVVGLKKSKAS